MQWAGTSHAATLATEVAHRGKVEFLMNSPGSHEPELELELTTLQGRPVTTYDDESLGDIVDVITERGGRRYLVVKSRMFGTGRYYVPESEIERIGERRVLLKTTRDDLRELDWLQPPAGYKA